MPLVPDRAAKPLLLFAHAVPILAAFALILRFIVNIPVIDDYPNFFGFILHLRTLPTFAARAAYFCTAQHDEYRFTFMHLLAAIQSTLTHSINFVALNLFGNLFLLALFALLWRILPVKRDLLAFLPVTLILFGLNYAEDLTWASSTLDYIPAMVFSFLALHLLVRNPSPTFTRSFALACFAALAAYLTAPNAILLLPLGFFLFIPRRAWLQACAWCLTFALGLVPYLYHYQRSAVPREPTTPRLFIVFFLSFLGSGNPAYRASALVGLLVLAVLAWSVRTGFYKTHPAAVLCALWIVGSAFLVALGRSHSGVEFALISRYKIFSDVLLIFCYSYAAHRFAFSPRSFQLAAAAALLFCFRADLQGYHILKLQRQTLTAGLQQFQQNPQQNSPMFFPDTGTQLSFSRQEAEARTLMNEAIDQHLYTPPR